MCVCVCVQQRVYGNWFLSEADLYYIYILYTMRIHTHIYICIYQSKRAACKITLSHPLKNRHKNCITVSLCERSTGTLPESLGFFSEKNGATLNVQGNEYEKIGDTPIFHHEKTHDFSEGKATHLFHREMRLKVSQKVGGIIQRSERYLARTPKSPKVPVQAVLRRIPLCGFNGLPKQRRVPSGKLTWQWKMDPFEDVFPIEHGDFPLLCLFTGG